MIDFFKSVCGLGGRDAARKSIKRMRAVGWAITICSLLACVAYGYSMPAGHRSRVAMLAVPVLLVLLVGKAVETGLEIQIRHLNSLALSPFETVRMRPSGLIRMWIGGAAIVATLIVAEIGIAERWPLWFLFWFPITALSLGVFLMSYRTGLSRTSSRLSRYDPDRDEFRWWWS